MGNQKEQINPALIAAFVKSTKNVLSTMVGIESTIGKPIIKVAESPSYDVSGIVGFTGEITGSVVVSFKEDCALGIVSAFTMEEYEVHTEDFADAVGELCNMIAGNAKKDFGIEAGIGIPNVVVGKNHVISRLKEVPCVVIPCECANGEFAVEVNIKQLTPAPVGV